MACAAAEPIVNGLETELANQIIVIRANIQTQNGKAVSSYLNSRVTPTFVLFDENGNEIWRQIGTLDAQAVTDLIIE